MSVTFRVLINRWSVDTALVRLSGPISIEGGATHYRPSDGTAAGLCFCADRAEFELAVLSAHLTDSNGWQKWRTWAKAKCAKDGVTAPPDEDLGGGTLNTQINGLQKVYEAYFNAGKQDHIFDLAADWNTSPKAQQMEP